MGTSAEEGDLKDERDIKSEEGSRDDNGDIDLGCNVVLESGVVVKEGCRIGEMSIVDVEGRLGIASVVGRVSPDSNNVLYLSLDSFRYSIVTFKHQVLYRLMILMKPFNPSKSATHRDILIICKLFFFSLFTLIT